MNPTNLNIKLVLVVVCVVVLGFMVGISITSNRVQNFQRMPGLTSQIIHPSLSSSSSSSSSLSLSSSSRSILQQLHSAAAKSIKSLSSNINDDVNDKSNERKNYDKDENYEDDGSVVVGGSVKSKNCQKSVKSKDESRQLLLITSGRSGSTFTASIISQSPGVFFTFEPLHVIGKMTRENIRLQKTKYQERLTGIVKAYLTCDLSNMNSSDLNLQFLTRSGRVPRDFYSCLQKTSTGFSHLQCLWSYIKYCKQSPLHFSKLIRLPMNMMEPILRDLPNLKVIYLIRDPRAVLYSMASSFGDFKWPILKEYPAKGVCESLAEDVLEVKRLHHLYPGRLKLVRYEIGASYPIAYAKDLYEFAGLNFTSRTAQYINSLKAGPSSADGKVYGVQRRNPEKRINAWRGSEGSYESALNIDKFCKDVYPLVGYVTVKSQKHLLSKSPLFDKDFKFQ